MKARIPEKAEVKPLTLQRVNNLTDARKTHSLQNK